MNTTNNRKKFILCALFGAFELIAGTPFGEAQELFRKQLISTAELDTRLFAAQGAGATKAPLKGNFSSWIRNMDSIQTLPLPRDLERYDDFEREQMARQALVRLAGLHLEKFVKGSSLRDAYDAAAKVVNRSKNLIAFNADPDQAPSGLTKADYKRRKGIVFGFDALRAFSPTLGIGDNMRIVSDVRRKDVLFEWRWGF